MDFRAYPIRRVLSVYDGDTVTLELDLGFDITYRAKCRLYGIDTPEMRGGTPETKEAAIKAKEAVKDWLEARKRRLWFVSNEKERGKYGRALGDITDFAPNGDTLTGYMLAEGHAVEYEV